MPRKAQFPCGDFQCGISAGFKFFDAVFVNIEADDWPFFSKLSGKREPYIAKAYDGEISGQFVVNGRKGLSVGGDLAFKGLALQALMADFANIPEQALTLVWASHNLGQVKRLATRVVYLEGGRVLADLPMADFFNPVLLAERSPAAHAFVQGELS
jgi:hypothetical protein